jgi:hypothetical protein
MAGGGTLYPSAFALPAQIISAEIKGINVW